MRPAGALLVCSGTWAAWGTLVGVAGARQPSSRFSHDNRFTRLHKWEKDGQTWRAIRVHKWKRTVPELGALFGGTSKKRLVPSQDGFEQLARETRRAEMVHWVAPLAVVIMPMWSPAWVSVVMFAYAALANAPCIIIQRYNRGRLCRLVLRRAAPQAALVHVDQVPYKAFTERAL